MNTTNDIALAIAHLQKRLREWHADGTIDDDQLGALEQSAGTAGLRSTTVSTSHFPTIDSPGDQHPLATLHAYELFVLNALKAVGEQRLNPDHSLQLCIQSTRERIAVVSERLTKIQAPSERDTAPSHEESKRTVQSLIESLLDPATLRTLMMCGSGLLVLGLVLWLWSIGLFENPVVAACFLGGLNLGALAIGVALVKQSRYQLAGRAITLLGCLVMPLNLWFYDAQGLIPIRDGGHLWVPALVCCLIYAGVARLLRDHVFVYALVGGVTATGMLLLADHQVEKILEILTPSILLIVLGLICIHVERLFLMEKGPFDRDHFGQAFFRSGHLLIASGVTLLFGARTVGLLHELWFSQFDLPMPAVASITGQKIATLLLVASALYGYAYSYLVVKRTRLFPWVAVALLIWSEWILFDIAAISLSLPVAISLLASTSIVLQLLSRFFSGELVADVRQALKAGSTVLLVIASLGSISLIGDGECLAVVAAGLTLSGWIWSSFAIPLDVRRPLAMLHAYGIVISGLVGFWVVADAWRVPHLQMLLPALLVAPVSIRCSAKIRNRLNLSELFNTELDRAADNAAGLLLLGGFVAYIPWFRGDESILKHLAMGGFFATLAALFGFRRVSGIATSTYQLLAAAAACAAGWELASLAGLTTFAPMVAASLVGGACLVASRLRPSELADDSHRKLETIGNLCITIGGAGSCLFAINQVLAGSPDVYLLFLLAGQTAVAITAGWLQSRSGWRRALFGLAVVETVAGLVAVHVLSALGFTDRIELFVSLAGMWLLTLGHLGWFRENKGKESMVSLYLTLGSLLACIPMLIGMVAYRVFDWSPESSYVLIHEIGVLVIGLLLLAAGNLCRIRATTVVGTGTLLVYVVTLLTLIEIPNRLQSVSVYMMVGGGAFFGIAVLLSVYRDRLLSVPDRVRNGDGVFQVLKWR